MMRTQLALDTERGTNRLPSTLTAQARRIVRGWWRAYWDRRARQLTVQMLNALDRRTLLDIGVHPSEIESSVYAPTADRRRRYDCAWR